MSKRLASLVGIGLLAAACGSGDKNRVLSRIEAAGDRCPNAGIVVVSGADDDGDGALDEGEIESTDLICDNDTLTRLDAIAPGDVCQTGGTAVHLGLDDNNNGQLEDGEIDSTQTVCKGTLSRTTGIGADEAACFGRGGVRIEFGVDDDADDILDVAEVDTTTISCNVGGTVTAPPGPDGTSQIIVSGGDSREGDGGNAGGITVQLGSSGGGSIALFRSGQAVTDFTVPVRTPVGTPYTVPASVDVAELTSAGVGPAADTLYACRAAEGGYHLYLSDGDAVTCDEAQVTSLVVPAGVTLRFAGTGDDPADIGLTDDLVVQGTIERGGTSRSLTLRARNYIGAAGSKIDLRGTPGGAGAGGVGGTLAIAAEGTIVNEGEIDVSGGLGGGTNAGGDAGSVFLQTNGGSVFNTGAIRASGGGSAEGVGDAVGNGGNVQLVARGGKVANRGAITAVGGAGLRYGGSGGTIFLGAQPGDVVNAGALDVNGATPAACTEFCRGGSPTGSSMGHPFEKASYRGVYLYSLGGGVFSSGALTAAGGDAPAADSCAGDGGPVTVRTASFGSISTATQGQIRLSGTIDASGGAGGSGNVCESDGGGSGGFVFVEAQARFPLGQEIQLLGYQSVVGLGGNGSSAGNGGVFSIFRPDSEGGILGPIVSNVDVTLPGGVSTSTESVQGGYGGQLNWVFDPVLSGSGAHRIETTGVITVDGGPGGFGGPGRSQGLLLYGPEGVLNRGALSANGGAGRDAETFVGGPAGGVILSSDVGPVRNEGSITAKGGTGFTGGFGGEICLEGARVTNTQPINAEGGNGTGGPSGNGNTIVLSSYNPSTENSGTLSVAAGTAGATIGTAGTVIVDSQSSRCFNFDD
jgi:hypothetical protein